MSDCVVLDGKAAAAEVRGSVKAEVDRLREKIGKCPGLATVLVGERPESAMYVRMKHKACAEAGIATFDRRLGEDVSQQELMEVVDELNKNSEVNGILVQLPLPNHISENDVLDTVVLEKDVDGFSPHNIGRLVMKSRTPLFESCVPKGCMEILKKYNIPLSGKQAVVVGRSNIVGIPIANMLLHENATVTVCHSHTQNLEEHVRAADIVVAAIGQAECIKADWVKPGATLVDVGTNNVPDESRKSGFRLVGDIEASAKQRAGAMTPVPGGVGPMTIAMLMSNTLISFKRQQAEE